MGSAWPSNDPLRSVQCKPPRRSGNPSGGRITLTVKGVFHQAGDLNPMMWNVPELIAQLSEFFALPAGDVILTGTSAGVCPLLRGDGLELTIGGFQPLSSRLWAKNPAPMSVRALRY